MPDVKPADLEQTIRTLADRGARAHPEIHLAEPLFIAHLTRHIAALKDTSNVDALFAEDLYLACACAEGNAVALSTFDRTLLPRVAPYVARVHQAPDFVADVLQTLRVKLLIAQGDKHAGIRDYAGRAPLTAWLRVAAVRTAKNMIKQDARYVTLGTDAGAGAAAPAGGSAASGSGSPNPEVGFLKEEGAAELHRAIERTLAELSDRDRALLRLYFVEGMSLAALGRIYHVHESTMMRRVHALRERLLDEVKKELGVDTVALASRVALVASRLDLHLGEHLRDRK